MPDILMFIFAGVLLIFGIAIMIIDKRFITGSFMLIASAALVAWYVIAVETRADGPSYICDVKTATDEANMTETQFIVFRGQIYNLNNFFMCKLLCSKVRVTQRRNFSCGVLMIDGNRLDISTMPEKNK